MPAPPRGKNWDVPSFHQLIHGLTMCRSARREVPSPRSRKPGENLGKANWKGERVSLGRNTQEILELWNGWDGTKFHLIPTPTFSNGPGGAWPWTLPGLSSWLVPCPRKISLLWNLSSSFHPLLVDDIHPSLVDEHYSMFIQDEALSSWIIPSPGGN